VNEREQAVLQERALFEGVWRIVRGERSGQELAKGDLDGGTVAFSGKGFVWSVGQREVRGTYSLDLHRTPKILGLSYWDGERQVWVVQNGIYEFEADRLRICLAPPGSFGNDLPINFSTKGTKSTTYTMHPMGADAGN
jgi:uncharacterized protein (TIGR03067 family)